MASPAPAAALTAKETEVLALLRRRLTNAEIAEQLYVSVRTVESHVSSLLRKFGVTTRRALADATSVDGQSPPSGSNAPSLPALRTAPIGREDDIAAASQQVHEVRLTTLVGPGGVGKTTIALAVAHDQAVRWPDGVSFVDLVPARAPSDVLRAIADAIGVDGDAARSVDDLGRHLAKRSALLVLDNCEHVVDHVAAFLHVALGHVVLGHVAAWHVLATSREAIGLTEEHLVPVEPLGARAAELFVERARQSEPRVAWDVSDQRIVDLCERLDGLPLAVELAAGQLRRWSIDELRRRLDDPTRRLPDRPGRGEPRHRTMDATIGWSYGLLDEPEQRLLRHLSVFPSRFELDAVGSLETLLDGVDVAATLASLVDKSLVVRETDTSSYRLLETIRTFASGRLEHHDEQASVFEHHRLWTVDRATGSSRLDRWFSGRRAAKQRLDADHVRQAFWMSLHLGQDTDAVELAMTRSFLWRNAVGCTEGHRWFDALVERDLNPVDRAWVRLLGCDIAQGDGDYPAMVALANEPIAADVDPAAHALARQFGALQHLLDPTRVDQVLAEVLAHSPDERLSNLLRAFSLVAHAGGLPQDELMRTVEDLEQRCSADGYDRFIHNWALWMHGLALRDPELARRGIAQQYEYLDRSGLSETWLTAYSLAVTEMIDGVSGRAQLAHAVEIADREGYRIEGDCMLALAYSEVCRGDAATGAELLCLARTKGFNATAHNVLHGVVVAPLVHDALDPAELRDADERSRARSVEATLADYGIRTPENVRSRLASAADE